MYLGLAPFYYLCGPLKVQLYVHLLSRCERGYLATKNALRWHGAGGVLRCREIAQKIMLLVGLPLVCLTLILVSVENTVSF
jgi:hypothetical protein